MNTKLKEKGKHYFRKYFIKWLIMQVLGQLQKMQENIKNVKLPSIERRRK